jgi:beta-lactamase class A
VASLLLVAGLATFANVQADREERQQNPPPEVIDTSIDPVTLASSPTTAPLNAPDPPDPTLMGAAYSTLAAGMPGLEAHRLYGVRQSLADPDWASVRAPVPGRDNGSYYAVFLERAGEEWAARHSVLIEDQDHPKDVTELLTAIPDDLVNPLFPPDNPPEPAESPKWRAVQTVKAATEREEGWEASEPESSGGFHRVEVSATEDPARSTSVFLRGEGEELEVAGMGSDLTTAELPGFPEDLAERGILALAPAASIAKPDLVRDGEAPALDGSGMEEAKEAVERYPGTAGFYAIDLESGAGYGVRPDEQFFSASTIKVAVMVAVYRRIDEGKLEYSDTFETQASDWAAGAGWLRWETPGAQSTVEDALWLMMTQSDNVATNALTRLVGGPEYVNEVARSLGAEDTELYWRLSSERAAVPALDNRTTPRDMATMLRKIAGGGAASDFACREMIGLLEQNQLEYWMEAGVPDGIPVANKAGWLDSTFNDAGIVEYEDRPYILAIFSKYGPEEAEDGAPILQDVSGAVWKAQTGTTVEAFEKQQKEEQKEAEEAEQKESNGEDAEKNGAN